MYRPKTSHGFYHVSSPKNDEPIDELLDEETLKRIEKTVLKYTQSRTPQVTKQVKIVQGPPGKVIKVVKRVVTPEPDKVVNVTYVEPQRDRIDLEIQKPRTPSPQIEEVKIIKDKKLPPEIKPRVKKVLSQKSQSKMSVSSRRTMTYNNSTAPAVVPSIIHQAPSIHSNHYNQTIPTYNAYYPVYNQYTPPQWNHYTFQGFF